MGRAGQGGGTGSWLEALGGKEKKAGAAVGFVAVPPARRCGRAVAQLAGGHCQLAEWRKKLIGGTFFQERSESECAEEHTQGKGVPCAQPPFPTSTATASVPDELPLLAQTVASWAASFPVGSSPEWEAEPGIPKGRGPHIMVIITPPHQPHGTVAPWRQGVWEAGGTDPQPWEMGVWVGEGVGRAGFPRSFVGTGLVWCAGGGDPRVQPVPPSTIPSQVSPAQIPV